MQQNPGCFKPSRCCNELFQNSFLSFAISESNKLNLKVGNIDTRPNKDNIYDIYDLLGVKTFHRLRLEFSHLPETKFTDTVSPLCSWSLEIESTKHYFLCCHNYVTFRTTLTNELNSIDSKFNILEPDELVRTVFYGDKIVDIDSFQDNNNNY